MNKIILILLMLLFIPSVSAFDIDFNTDNLYGVTREVNTVYYNNETHPIYLNIGVNELGSGSGHYHYQLRINNNSIVTYEHELANNEPILFSFNFIIPSNSTYEISKTVSLGSVYSWYEHHLEDSIITIEGNSLKAIIINDDINIDYITDYNYSVFINGIYWKDIRKDELLLVPDNVDILIYVPSPIKTDFSQAYNVTKPMFIIVTGILITFSIFIIFIVILYNKLIKKGR